MRYASVTFCHRYVFGVKPVNCISFRFIVLYFVCVNFFVVLFVSGTWLLNTRHDHGVLEYSNGDSYHGCFVNDLREGGGLMVYKNGDVYSGKTRVFVLKSLVLVLKSRVLVLKSRFMDFFIF